MVVRKRLPGARPGPPFTGHVSHVLCLGPASCRSPVRRDAGPAQPVPHSKTPAVLRRPSDRTRAFGSFELTSSLATLFGEQTQSLQGEWRVKLGRIRRNSATDLLLHVLPGAPVITVGSAAAHIGRTFRPVNDAVERLTDAGILRQITTGRRNRAFEARASSTLSRTLSDGSQVPPATPGSAHRHGASRSAG
jgi:hypothetical protein